VIFILLHKNILTFFTNLHFYQLTVNLKINSFNAFDLYKESKKNLTLLISSFHGDDMLVTRHDWLQQ